MLASFIASSVSCLIKDLISLSNHSLKFEKKSCSNSSEACGRLAGSRRKHSRANETAALFAKPSSLASRLLLKSNSPSGVGSFTDEKMLF